ADSAPQAGDLGWAEKDISLDQGYLDAVFSVEADVPTEVIEGKDGVFRIGRATEIDPERVDVTYETQIEEAEMTLDAYREAVRADVVRQKLDDKVVADLSKPGLQRQVEQIYLRLPTTTPPAEAVKVRHILFAPNDDPQAASTLPKSDPAWGPAEEEAQAAYETLKADTSKFDAMARTLSDEGSALSSGGKQPFYDSNSLIDESFAEAILAPGLMPGELLEPVETSFGWHVIQILRTYGEGDEAWLKSIREQTLAGADFEDLARDQGDGPEAEDGGDLGWIAKGTIEAPKETPIFAADVGGLTDVVTIPDDGSYLWKILAEETRTPTEDQIEIFKANGFDTWYSDQYDKADIDLAASASGVTG
ncbi:MAG: peptidylprolyl isomerase, partial [Chloroflexi bacterium]|nr:peptidylprolyl isomerase [Chloroflexota bacterium]